MSFVQLTLFWTLYLLCLPCRAAPPPAARTASPAGRHERRSAQPGRKLHGRFLHITDIHPDPFYKTYSSTESDSACHRHKGPAGLYGAETSGCDTPISLVNETFKWIEANLKDTIDFVIWTGDSARHDNDDKIPRTKEQIIEQNEFVVTKFVEVFGKRDDASNKRPTDVLTIPIVPTFGNNDIMPHNIFLSGPNRWTLKYLDIWHNFIPEEQRHQFQRGGWFFVEVIPGRLAVVSLNTIYFFASNSAVNGCGAKDEPGYEHMEWLGIQLELLRDRGMKVILMGHVPPARTENKLSWDETCWQKFTLWQRQYRDIIVSSLFGHMNIDHFMLQDFMDLNKDTKEGRMEGALNGAQGNRVNMLDDGEVTVSSASDYLVELRKTWSKLPTRQNIKSDFEYLNNKRNKDSVWIWIKSRFSRVPAREVEKMENGHSTSKREFMHKIGGKWGERFSVAHVSPSVVPNYFPTLRVYEYNITGLEELVIPTNESPGYFAPSSQVIMKNNQDASVVMSRRDITSKKKGKTSRKKHKKYKFKVPNPPSKSTPPGPAYSPQTLTLTGYVQYFANLTHINNDFLDALGTSPASGPLDGKKWKEGKHHGKKTKHAKPHPKKFKYEIEYNTTNDKIYNLKDLTVMSYLDLATKIGTSGRGASTAPSDIDMSDVADEIKNMEDSADIDDAGKKKKKKKKKHRKHKYSKKDIWFNFVKRAFVGTLDADDIEEQFSEVHERDDGSSGDAFEL